MNSSYMIGSWSARNTDFGAVGAATRQLRGRHDRGAFRTAVATIVALADDDVALAAELTEVVRELTALTPVQSLVISVLPNGEPGIDVGVTARVLQRMEGRGLCVDDVSIRVRGSAAQHMDQVVEPFKLPGIPIVVWLPRRFPREGEPLPAAADRVLVDTHRLPGTWRFGDLACISDRLPVTDLSWIRLEPWRHTIGSLFVGAEFAPFVRGVYRVDVEGKPHFGLLLAGWLMSRLLLAPDAVRVTDADAISVKMWSAYGGQQACFAVSQMPDRFEIHATAIIEGGPSHRRILLLPARSLAEVIDRALARSVTDELWKQALVIAAELGDP